MTPVFDPGIIDVAVAAVITAIATWAVTRSWYHHVATVASASVDIIVESGELLVAVREMLRDGATSEEVRTTIDEARDVIEALRRLAP